jgi:hypothetical protein
MPATIKLHRFGRVCRDAFDATAYLVGSALHTTDWRDVDVRVILSDEEYERQIGELRHPPILNARYAALCEAFSALGREMTGLPIDFQIDQQSDANERYDKARGALFFDFVEVGSDTGGERG